jgi:methyl-accepting chemotaxis protein
MKWVIFILIVFFIVLIFSQVFLRYLEKVVEGLENVDTTTTSGSSINTLPSSSTPTTSTGNSISPSVSSSSINNSSIVGCSIGGSNINSVNPSYMPYNSTSENLASFVEQNANNISFLKTKMDTLYQQVQDISGNVSVLNGTTSQIGKVSDVITQTQAAIPTSPPKVSGTSQSPETIDKLTDLSNSLIQ